MLKFIITTAMFGIALAVFIVLRVKEWRYSKKKWAIQVDDKYFSLVTKLEIDAKYKCVIFYDMREEEYRCVSFRNIRGYEVDLSLESDPWEQRGRAFERVEVCDVKRFEKNQW